MDGQTGEVCEGEADPEPSPGTRGLPLTGTRPAVFRLSPPIESLPSILCHLPGPPAQIPFPHPPMEERGSHIWSPVLCLLLTRTEHLLCAGQEFP